MIARTTEKSNWYSHPMYAKYRTDAHLNYIDLFQPKKHYVGVAWYQKDVWISKEMLQQKIELNLERVHWESQLYVNCKLVGSCNSLLAPHRYEITDYLLANQSNNISIRVDNGEIVDVGSNAHSWGDQTMTAWNGIVGDIQLIQSPNELEISDFEIYPDIDNQRAHVAVTVNSRSKKNKTLSVTYCVKSTNNELPKQIIKGDSIIAINSDSASFSFDVNLGDKMLLWDEYNPNLYEINISVTSNNSTIERDATFGMREITHHDNRFYINGIERYFRGNSSCGSFPITGYASMEENDWTRIFMIYKQFGINHIRFHSWTPPKAAFKAADELGLYLLPETNVWTSVKTDKQLHFLQEEGRRLLKEYGNHPSFVMMGIGNELSAKKEITNALLTEWKKDPRRLYSGLANSQGSVTDLYDFAIDRRYRSNTGWPPRPEVCYFHKHKPSSDFTFGDPVKYSFPLISHEVGQQCSYPDLSQDIKYTGSQKVGYTQIAREQLLERGMLDQWKDFVKYSGMLQVLFYKYELEAYRRAPKHPGYQILQLEDFPGQGGALVGVLDYFYDTKGYVTADKFTEFNGECIILAEMEKFTWENNELFNAECFVSNWGAAEMADAKLNIKIVDEQGCILKEDVISNVDIPRGDAVKIADFSFDLSSIEKAQKLKLITWIEDDNIHNSWDIWVYPEFKEPNTDLDKMIVTKWDDNAKSRLEKGETVILQLDGKQIEGEMPPAFLPIYWTQFDQLGNSQSLGLICNPKHGLFNDFPTDAHTNWQWWELLKDAKPITFDKWDMKDAWSHEFRPLLQLIDGWKSNRKIGVLAEAKYGLGKLIITSLNLTDSLAERIVVSQFRTSLLNYIKSSDFSPAEVVDNGNVEAILSSNTKIISESIFSSVTASSEHSLYPAEAIIDNNSSTIWHNDYRSGAADRKSVV